MPKTSIPGGKQFQEEKSNLLHTLTMFQYKEESSFEQHINQSTKQATPTDYGDLPTDTVSTLLFLMHFCRAMKYL